uniref:NADH dehydrogenase subunit 6 n=1 Tax=Inioteuthis japonica TaxID=2756228 RepID=A0A8F5CE22_9MOLL|nr:NADH dehydrogenase subunit 6 [Inioteuthis japonica]QXJ42107.1 NADH dehydrogenase subunit 6 [Inioteuthis japonica]
MSLLLMISLGFSLSSVSMMVIQPLSLGFMLMNMVFVVSVLTSIIIFNWYGYLLFLVYVGGMLVMFMYVISLIPNFIFVSGKVFFYFFSIFFSFMMMNFFVMKDMVKVSNNSVFMFNYDNMTMGGSSIIMMYNNFFCYLLLGIILLFVLISVVKICYYCEGPLRVFKFK